MLQHEQAARALSLLVALKHIIPRMASDAELLARREGRGNDARLYGHAAGQWHDVVSEVV